MDVYPIDEMQYIETYDRYTEFKDKECLVVDFGSWSTFLTITNATIESLIGKDATMRAN